MTRLRVLFVDDDRRALDGLERALADMRSQWEMEFVSDPRAAVAAAAKVAYDVVISDLRMPSMGGAELMARIRESSPSSVRMILSGDSDTDEGIRAASVTHQFLAKPCDPIILKAAITRVSGLRRLVRRDALLALVNRIDALPKVPAVYQRLIVALRDPTVTTARIGAILGSDPGLCTEMLKLANSAFFRVSTPIDRIDRAVQMVGVSNVAGLVAASAIKQSFRNPDVPPEMFDDVWNDSLRAAQFAGVIGKVSGVGTAVAEPAITAGLLHDVGRLVFFANLWPDYRQVDAAVALGEARPAAEERILGVTSGDLGYYLLGLWNLPERVVEAVAHQAEPGRSPDTASATTAIVHLANRLAAEFDGAGPVEETADRDYLVRAGIPLDWEAWRAGCQEAIGDLAP